MFNDLTLAIAPGITGLLGPNGAGKTTLLSLLSTQRSPRSGRVTVLGSDAATSRGRETIRSQIGVLSQRFPLVGSMRVVDTVAYAAWAQGLSRQAAYPAAEHALLQMGIADLEGRRCRSLSGGQRQRVGLAAALAHSPDLLILDEPSAGLDPLVRMSLRKTLVEVSQRCSVLLSTHLIDDVLTMCPRLVVLNAGEVAFEGPTGGLADLGEGVSTEVSASPLERGYSALLGQQ